MNRLITSLILFFTLSPSAFSNEKKWELLSTADDIKVFGRDVENSSLIELKGEGIIKAPIGKVINVLMGGVEKSKFLSKIKNDQEVSLLKKVSNTEAIIYTHLFTPPLVSDRDFITNSKIEIVPHKKFLFTARSIDYPMPKTEYVRAVIKDGNFTFEMTDDPNKTKMTLHFNGDPKGSIPQWIVNAFQKDWTSNTIKNFRILSTDPDVPEHPTWSKYFKPGGPTVFPEPGAETPPIDLPVAKISKKGEVVTVQPAGKKLSKKR